MKPGDLIKFSNKHVDYVYAHERWNDHIFLVISHFKPTKFQKCAIFNVISFKDNNEYKFFEDDLILVQSM